MTALQERTSSPAGFRLPAVRGRLTRNAPLGKLTWFGVGGPAEFLFRPADAEDLAGFVAGLPPEIPITVMGVGSNLLVRDGGIDGVVIRLGRDFARVAIEGDEVTAGAGTLDLNVALAAAQAGVAGLEFLSGIPGTVGGGVRMNAGAYGFEFKDVLVDATALDRAGRRHRLPLAAIGFSYRHSSVEEDWIFIAARFAGRSEDPAAIATRMQEIRDSREATQPIRAHTGGSTFKNPPGDSAWRLIDAAGCRGLALGGAQVSEKHTNFLINTGGASAADIEALGEEVRRRVHESSGLWLEWEIRRLGRPLGEDDRLPAEETRN